LHWPGSGMMQVVIPDHYAAPKMVSFQCRGRIWIQIIQQACTGSLMIIRHAKLVFECLFVQLCNKMQPFLTLSHNGTDIWEAQVTMAS
jgi:hypothetical protein